MTEPIRAYKFYPARWGREALYRRRLKVSTNEDINDPFEFMATGLNAASRKEARRIRSEMFAEHGIISFSETWSEPLLWSHYADNHRGLALGFDLDPKSSFRVEYTKVRVALPNQDTDVLQTLGCTKFEPWKYEKEVRIFPSRPMGDFENGLFFTPFEKVGKLATVVLGAKYEPIRDEALMRCLQDEGVEVITARLAFKDFSVVGQKSVQRQKEL